MIWQRLAFLDTTALEEAVPGKFVIVSRKYVAISFKQFFIHNTIDRLIEV
jgi:hypothetical protein